MVQTWDSAPPVLLGVATDMTPGVYNFVESARAAGWDARLLGVGVAWAGFRTKMICYHDACAALPPGTLTICADTSDVLVQGSPAAVSAAWRAAFLGSRVVFGVETLCGPNCVPVQNLCAAQWGPSPAAWPAEQYINSGLLIGTAAELTQMWAWMIDAGEIDDQIGAAAYVNAVGPAGFVLDTTHALTATYVWGIYGSEDMAAAPLMHFPGFPRTAAWSMNPTKYAQTAKRLIGARAMPIGAGREFLKVVLPICVLGVVLLVVFGAVAIPGLAGANAFAIGCTGGVILIYVIRRQIASVG